MRGLVLSATIAALMSSVASAADLTAADIAPAFAPQEPYSWTGAYLGLFGGFAAADIEVTDEDGYNGEPGRSFEYDTDGFYGGGIAGYNYEWSLLVFGVEGELAVIDLEDSEQDPTLEGMQRRRNDSLASSQSNFYGAVTGRVGLSIDRFLAYGKGGFAVADLEASFEDGNPAGAVLDTDSDEEWLVGFTVGGGIEMAVNPQFSLRGEYTFTEFDGGVTTTGTDPAGQEFEFEHDMNDLHMGKFVASYRF